MTMIAGHGIDLVEIERMRRILSKHGGRFTQKFFDPRENEQAKAFKDPAPFYAARFAAKEAFSKSMGTGFTGFGLGDVAVLRDENGPPHFDFSPRLKKLFPGIEPEDFILSISHEKGMAAASVIRVKKR